MEKQLKDAVDTLRIFTQALGHTQEINTESWEETGLLNTSFLHQGFHLSLWMHKGSETPTIDATLIDISSDPSRVIVNVSARPEFVLEVVKQAADRYPAKQVA